MTAGTETKYAMNGDFAVAYRSFGEGERDLVFVSNWFTDVELLPQVPIFETWLEQISRLGRLIIFDQPGTGLSDPLEGSLPSLEQWTDSIRVVMDAVGSDRASLLAVDGAFPIAALFAATYPARTTALIALGGYARSRQSPDYPPGLTDDQLKTATELLAGLWGTGETQHVLNPDLPWSEEIRSAWARSERAAASPAVFRKMMPLTFDLDVTDILGSIRVPTLIIQHADNPFLGGSGRYLGDHIKDAKYVELPGQNLYPVGSDAVAEISEFLTGDRNEMADDERVLATVLFTDIVGSTKRAAELGDRDWHALLDAHDAVVRAQLARFRGREVKTVGDGFLATFDGPQRAIKCALAIRDAVGQLGVDVRAGLHTGECEIRGEDIGGIAVHIGARVAAFAGTGEVLVSSTVRDLVVGSGLNFEDRGPRELKGVPGTWTLYAVAA